MELDISTSSRIFSHFSVCYKAGKAKIKFTRIHSCPQGESCYQYSAHYFLSLPSFSFASEYSLLSILLIDAFKSFNMFIIYSF